jgi:hypothetical protein
MEAFMSPGVWIWGGLAAASGISLALGRPWTRATATRRYPEAVRALPAYSYSHLVITAGWTAYFVLAALVSALVPSWAAPILAAPAPLGAGLSHRLGPKIAQRRMARA